MPVSAWSDGGQPRVVAFHLPQYHPIPENDAWWGPGFTEWANVAKARPLFRGHSQPNLPGELGFYDLRLPETRAHQAFLAQSHGIDAFCFWHYWFAGRRLLERPVQEMLESGLPDMPFCLAWANQTWTGVWHGAPGRILMEQTYPGPEDEGDHFRHLLAAFTDPRYLTVDGKPVFYIFRPEQLPSPQDWTARWQAMARAAGLPGLYLIAEVSDLIGNGPVFADVRTSGFDAGVYVRIPADRGTWPEFKMRLRRKARGGPEVYPRLRDLPTMPSGERLLPCVYPNWDNTPRSGRRGVVLTGSTPEGFRRHLGQALELVSEQERGEQRLVFVKSWNEWAEGNYLEPDAAVGRGWLHAVRDATAAFSRKDSAEAAEP